MRKRKWYERMSAAVLIAVLLVNHGDMGIMAKAETIPALEENLEEENKKIEAETASASNADEKRDIFCTEFNGSTDFRFQITTLFYIVCLDTSTTLNDVS